MAGSAARVIGFLSLALLAYLLLCLLAFLFQRQMTYFPWRWDEAAARAANPGHEDVRIRTEDGETLHGWLRRREGAPWTVVIFHGNAGNLSVQEQLMQPFVALDLQVLLFDYRGFGLSTGRPTQSGLIRDGEAAARFVEEDLKVPPERVAYYGKSLGTGVAVLLAARRPPARLILESSFDSLVSVARHHHPYLPVGLLMHDRFDAGSIIGRLGLPVLVFHPSHDEIIPLNAGRALFKKARDPKRFLEIPGAGHNDPPGTFPPFYLDAIREFLGLRR